MLVDNQPPTASSFTEVDTHWVGEVNLSISVDSLRICAKSNRVSPPICGLMNDIIVHMSTLGDHEPFATINILCIRWR